VEVIYYRHGESGASILDAASVKLNLRQDGCPKGRDSLLALFTTAVSLQGRRPARYLLFSAQRINTRRDKQQDAE
jgi:hypothetical protein